MSEGKNVPFAPATLPAPEMRICDVGWRNCAAAGMAMDRRRAMRNARFMTRKTLQSARSSGETVDAAELFRVRIEELNRHRSGVERDDGDAAHAPRLAREERPFVQEQRRDGIGAGAADQHARARVDQLEVVIVTAEVEVDSGARRLTGAG